ncbi:hypothetical protein SISNIDRAFT_464924 [Sistotremastrum niveocremeum HHB9708]|uniref:Uncharacterized protein n=1 Tax=Sistotremastrum niveocremeum HHB9708 TaxID=1314777 RepID=A0A164WRM9_9AGAM|nr:hypothetical protein SISNIDRAFT_464924 [Sistotremastrum niveocremeum HHB9708]
MAQVQALSSTALACVYWKDTDKVDHIRVYFQDSSWTICEARWDNGVWKAKAKSCFTGPQTGTPLAALAYPGDGHEIPGADPEIQVYYRQDGKIKYHRRSEGVTDTWSYAGEVDTYNLAETSNIGVCEFYDPYIRVYYQDTAGDIRVSTWNSGSKTWVRSTGGANLRISEADKPARTGTPIGTDTENAHNLSNVVVAWHDKNKHLAGAIVKNDSPTPIKFPKDIAVSPSGTVTVAVWDLNHIHIYYDGVNDGIQKLEYASNKWSDTMDAFTGDITNPYANGQGSLASAAYAPANTGTHTGSVFYQPVDGNSIVEILI